jgi:hypothetical protein
VEGEGPSFHCCFAVVGGALLVQNLDRPDNPQPQQPQSQVPRFTRPGKASINDHDMTTIKGARINLEEAVYAIIEKSLSYGKSLYNTI